MPISMKQWKQVAAGVIVSLGCCSQGMAVAFSSSAIPQMRKTGAEFYVTEKEASLIAAIVHFTSGIGSLFAGAVMDIIGRRLVLLLSGIPVIAGFILVAAAQNFTTIMIGRVLIGLFTGATAPSAAVYISESTEPSIRGTIAVFVMFALTIGNLLEFILGAISSTWRVMTWISTAVPVVFFVCMVLIPESPRYLMTKNKKEEAFKAMTWLRPNDCDIAKELGEIEVSLNNAAVTQIRIQDLVTSHNLKMYIFTVVLGLLFGTCGGPVLILFVEPLIIDLHSIVSPKIVAVIVGVIQLIGMSISLYFVDTVGRRRLLQISAASMSFSALSLSLFTFIFPPEQARMSNWNYLPAILVILFMFSFSLGFRGIPLGLVADLLPTSVRGIGTASACLVAFGFMSVLAGFFLPMITTIKIHGTFLFYGCICCVCYIFPTLFIPETKGKTLEELQVETKEKGIFMGIALKQHKSNRHKESDDPKDGVENIAYGQES